MNTRIGQSASGRAIILSRQYDSLAAREPQEPPKEKAPQKRIQSAAVQSPIEMQKVELAIEMAARRKRTANVAISIGAIGVGVMLVGMGSGGRHEHNCRDGYYTGSREERLCQEYWREERAGSRLIGDGASQLTSDGDNSRAAFFRQYGGGGARYGGFGGSGSLHFSGGG